MNYGMEISASAALTAVYRQEVLTNNLSNLNTVGFKPDIAGTMQRDPARVEDGLWDLPSNDLLEKLGAGVLSAPNRISFKQGPLTTTGNPLDLAVEGDGFLVIREQIDANTERLRLSRDGRLARDSRGRLVLAGNGLPVLDTANRTITIPDAAEVKIDPHGTIRADGVEIAQIQLADVPDRSRLVKYGEGMFTTSNNQMESRFPASGRIQQAHIEGSAVDPIDALLKMTSAARAAQGAFGMISTQDRLVERAISTLGRAS